MPSGTRSLSARALTNIQLAELFARDADSQQDQRQRALRRASRRALMWPEEAWRLRQTGRPLTELASVGPWIASKLEEWMVDPPEVPEPPPLRSGFRSYAECRDIVGADPVWRKAVRADLQMHTSETDGALPLGEMVDAAGEFGHEFIAITDHSKGLAITNGMDEVRLARQGEEIAALNRRGQRPRVLRSIEMNISPLGVEDMARPALRELDLVLGAFHSKLTTKADRTDRYLAALDTDDPCPRSSPRAHLELPHRPQRRVGASSGACRDGRHRARDRRLPRPAGRQRRAARARATRGRPHLDRYRCAQRRRAALPRDRHRGRDHGASPGPRPHLHEP